MICDRSSEIEREDLQNDSETFCDVRFADGGNDKIQEAELEMLRFLLGVT